MRSHVLLYAAAALSLAGPAAAAEVSTHVLDLARGVGGRNVPVTLLMKTGDDRWTEVARARTDQNGRVRAFEQAPRIMRGTYKLHFDTSQYPDTDARPFFPEIEVIFRVSDEAAHYHVPIVLSPFGYSTYRGN